MPGIRVMKCEEQRKEQLIGMNGEDEPEYEQEMKEVDTETARRRTHSFVCIFPQLCSKNHMLT